MSADMGMTELRAWQEESVARASAAFHRAVAALKAAKASGDLWQISNAEADVSEAWDILRRRAGIIKREAL